MNIVLVLLIFFIGLLYRVYGSFESYPFWVDEFSTAKNARYILDYGVGIFTNPNISFEIRNLTVNFLGAIFFKLLGQEEWAVRLPLIIIGSMVPAAIYLLTNKITNKTVAVCASVLAMFSYFFITWSRQARAYVLFQLLVLLAFYQYFKLLKKFSAKQLFLFFLIILLGNITHPLIYIAIFSIIIHFSLFKNKEIIAFFSSKTKLLFLFFFSLILLFLGWQEGAFGFITANFFSANNAWYYHSFLWREYGLITFLGILGLMIGLLDKRREFLLIVLYVFFHLIFINFVWGHYMTKYILPIFPFLFIGVGYFITKVTSLLINEYSKSTLAWRSLRGLFPILIILFIIVNGDKFVIKPKKYYSLNQHFREIANIDYHQVYSIIKTKGKPQEGKTAVIDTWPDRVRWYLGNDFKNLYYFKWQNEPGIVSGHVKITEFYYNQKGEKITKGKEPVMYIGELSDLLMAIKKYPKGFIFIDDSTLQKDVIDYAEKNLKNELYLDHYPLDDNPYSVWPATLYSWGIN